MTKPEWTACLMQAIGRSCRLLASILLLCTLAAPAAVQGADADAGLEARVKAAFLYKFTGYVEWPDTAFAQPDSPIAIAVIGADAIATELGQVTEGRKVNGRPIQVRRLKAGDALAGFHILFVGDAAAAQMGALMRAARPLGILAVTESEGALALGSVINFVVADRRVRFEISRDSAGKNRLRLSSRLLAVAQSVTEQN